MLGLLAANTSAAAAAVATGSQADEPVAPHRFRSGVVVGAAFGAGVVGASGYPNDVTQIGDPRYYAASGWMVGTSTSLMLMGALTDYLSFGFWYAHATAENRDFRSRGDGGGLRVEAFPLVSIAPSFAGLGLAAQFGIGSANLPSKTPGVPTAEGTQSFVGAGVFHEWTLARLLGGHLAAGPSLEYDAIWSQPFERHGLTASARVVFYGGP